jgi:hypothetical protein
MSAIFRVSSTYFWRCIPFLGLLLVLGVVGCGSSGGAAQSTSAIAVEPTSLPAQPTPTRPAPELASPTPSLPPATATPTLLPPTPTASPTPLPSPTPSPTPTPTPALRRLTTAGCCTQPFWSPDSRWVLFIDKPAPDAPLGIWGVDVTQPGATPQLLTERIAFYTDDLSYVVDYGGRETAIERLDGPLGATVAERWTVPAAGRPISISPGRTRIAWQVSNDDLPVERRVTEIWVSDFDGTAARSVATLPRGGLSGWISDDLLLLSGRDSLQSRETVVYTLSLLDGATVELVRAERPRGYSLSPGGRWLAYFITFSDDPAQNGLWLVRTDGSERRQLDPELLGDYQWRDAGRLLLIPFESDAVYHAFWQYDVETGAARRLTDPDVTPFKVANADWQLSPDGRQVVFVENSDRNLWLLSLNDGLD